MAENISVRLRGALRDHLERQIGDEGFYDGASEYLRDLIRQDLKRYCDAQEARPAKQESGSWADSNIVPGMSVNDVAKRN